MLWKYILKIRVDNDIVYKRDKDQIDNCILDLDEEKSLLDKNTTDCEILSNMEVLKNARKC